MYVVIFRARSNELTEEYRAIASRMRDLALGEYNCRQFVSVSENGHEIALSYWDNEQDIRAWKQQSDHIIAQQYGRERWYNSYVVQVAEITREYSFSSL